MSSHVELAKKYIARANSLRILHSYSAEKYKLKSTIFTGVNAITGVLGSSLGITSFLTSGMTLYISIGGLILTHTILTINSTVEKILKYGEYGQSHKDSSQKYQNIIRKIQVHIETDSFDNDPGTKMLSIQEDMNEIIKNAPEIPISTLKWFMNKFEKNEAIMRSLPCVLKDHFEICDIL